MGEIVFADFTKTPYRLTVKAGDVVLLSPAAASFDKFKNATDRGDQFRAAVQGIASATTTLKNIKMPIFIGFLSLMGLGVLTGSVGACQAI